MTRKSTAAAPASRKRVASAPPPEVPPRDRLRLEYVALSELRRWPRNPKKHADDGIAASIKSFGFNDPFLVDETSGRIVEGHGRLDALEKKKLAGEKPPERIDVRADGEWLVPLLRGVAFESEEKARAYLIAHNRLTELGGWDPDALKAEHATLPAELKDLSGWTDKAIERLAKGEVRTVEFTSKVPEVQEQYMVVVTCKNEKHQVELLEEMKKRGLAVRALVS